MSNNPRGKPTRNLRIGEDRRRVERSIPEITQSNLVIEPTYNLSYTQELTQKPDTRYQVQTLKLFIKGQLRTSEHLETI